MKYGYREILPADSVDLFPLDRGSGLPRVTLHGQASMDGEEALPIGVPARCIDGWVDLVVEDDQVTSDNVLSHLRRCVPGAEL